MFVILAALVASGAISALLATSIYYGVTGLTELAEVIVFTASVLLYWAWTSVGPGRKARSLERDLRRQEMTARFDGVTIETDDGRVLAPGSYGFDEDGIPKLD